MKYILIWPNPYIFSYDVCSALHWLNNGVMLIHSGRWPLIIFSWADRETRSWCNFWAADWKKLKRNLNAHRPDLLVFLILLKMSWQPLAQTCLGALLVYQGGKLFRVPKSTPTDMSLCCFQTRQGPPTAPSLKILKYSTKVLIFYFYVLKQRKLRWRIWKTFGKSLLAKIFGFKSLKVLDCHICIYLASLCT